MLACGQREPDGSKDVTLTMDGHPVVVPVGKPKAQPKHKDSSFYQSEYLVYKESQVCVCVAC